MGLTILASANQVLRLNLDVLWWHWALLAGWFIVLILLDIFVLHRKDHVPDIKEAMLHSAGWILLGIILGVIVWVVFGGEAGAQYFSGYLVEKSLSIDNVFTWALILSYFGIPKKYQHRVLFWGVIGAIILRIIFVFAGIAIIERFEPILLLFGLMLIWSGLKIIATNKSHVYNPKTSNFYRVVSKFITVSKKLDGHKLFTRENGKRTATILFMALLMVEFTDVVFAVDSVPAILAVSREPFIIIASNAAAILGMRALYFVFDIIKGQFWLLHYSLGTLLLFVGLKMFIAPGELLGINWFDTHISTNWSLVIIGFLLTIGVLGSLLIKKPKKWVV